MKPDGKILFREYAIEANVKMHAHLELLEDEELREEMGLKGRERY